MTGRYAFNGLVLVCFGLAALAALLKTAEVYSDLQERKTLYDFIPDAADPQASVQSSVSWLPPVIQTDRPVTPFDENKIGQALAEAWAGYTKSMSNGETMALSNYFSSIALSRAELASASAYEDGTRLVVLDQSVQPQFFHLDGSLFQAQARNLTVRFDNGAEFLFGEDHTVTSLTNGSNGWRIFSHELRGFEEVVHERDRVSEFPELKGMNYYPADTPWSSFWSNYDEEVIEDDFQKILSLNANAVRVFLPYNDFADPDTKAANLLNLENLLQYAEKSGLYVVPTLFDLKPDFRPETWAQDVVYLRDVLEVLKAKNSVAFIDLKNEADLDFEYYTQPAILAWAKSMLSIAHREFPELMWTLGWSNAEVANLLTEQLDVISYHEYSDIDKTLTNLEKVKKQSLGKQVFVTEVGETSHFPAMEHSSLILNRQAKAIEERINGLSGSDGVFVWTLYDFEETDDAAISPNYLTVNQQKRFGLFKPDGSEKPAAEVVRRAFE